MKNSNVVYELYADEAWTHQNIPYHRYHTFFGGAFAYEKQIARLENSLRAIRPPNRREIKWQSADSTTLPYYVALIDTFKDHVLHHGLRYRQMFNDRFFDYQGNESDVDSQFKLYYQFLKHHIPWQEIADKNPESLIQVNVRLDNYSSQRHKSKLKDLGEKIPSSFNISNIKINISFVDSKKFIVLQVCDLIMGAAGYQGNRMHYERHNQRRGMTNKQKARVTLSKHIYTSLREIDAKFRHTKVFNWFSSTGFQLDSRLELAVSIWKFRPNNHIENKKWNTGNFPDRRSLSEDNMIEKQ